MGNICLKKKNKELDSTEQYKLPTESGHVEVLTYEKKNDVNGEEDLECTSPDVMSSGYSSITKTTSHSQIYKLTKTPSVARNNANKVQPVCNHGPSSNNDRRDLSLRQISSTNKRGLKKEDKDRIKRRFCYLKKNLDSVSSILDHCIQESIITDDHAELINAEPTRRQKVDCLIRKLLQSQHDAFPVFLDILTATGNDHIRKALESEVRDDIADSDDRKRVYSWKARNVLDTHRKEIIDELQPELVVDYLFQYGQFSLDEYELVISKKTRKKQVVQLMKILASERHMPRGYAIFVKALQDDAQLYLYQLLESETKDRNAPNSSAVNIVHPDVEFLQTDEDFTSDVDDVLLIKIELRTKNKKKQEEIIRKVDNEETRQKINDILLSETSCLMESISKGSIIIRLKGCSRGSIKRLFERGYETGISRILGIIFSSPEVKRLTENETLQVRKVEKAKTTQDFGEIMDYKEVLRRNIAFLMEELDPGSFLHLAIFTQKEKESITVIRSTSRSEGANNMIKLALTKSDDDLQVLLEEIKRKKLYVWEFMFQKEKHDNPRETVMSNYSLLVENICPSLIVDHCAQSDLVCIDTYQQFLSQGKPRSWITKFILQEVLKTNDVRINRFLNIISTSQQNLYSMIMSENGNAVLTEEDQGVDSETDWTEDDIEEEMQHMVNVKEESANNDGGYNSMSPKSRRTMFGQLSAVPSTSSDLRNEVKEDDSGYNASPRDKLTKLRGLACYPDKESMPESAI